MTTSPTARGGWKRRFLLAYLILLAASYVVWGARDSEPPAKPGAVRIELPMVGGAPSSTVQLSYRDSRPDSATGLPVILVHGSPGSIQDFDKLAQGMGTRRVIVPDLPGFGGSLQSLPDYSARAHARYLIMLLKELDVPRAHFVGFSMGGAVLLELAHAAPEQVASLSLVAAIGVQELEMFGRYDLNHLVHGGQLMLIQAVRWGFPHFGRFDNFPLNVAYARNFYDTDQRPLRAYLQAYAGPLFIYHGSRDFLVPAEVVNEHSRLAPQAEQVVVDASHFVLWTRTEEVGSRLGTFLTRVERGEARVRSDATPDQLSAAEAPWNPEHAPPFTGPTLLVMMALLILATFVSEDLTCIATGFVVAQGRLDLTAGVLACFVGLVVGDLLLYLLGRWFGRPAIERFPLRFMVSEEGVDRASAWFAERGARVVLMARVIPGLRLPTYVAAGVLKTNVWACLGYFAFAAAIWTPLLVGGAALAAYVLGANTDLMQTSTGSAFLVIAVVFVLTERVGVRLFSHRSRRQLLGSWKKWRHFEFWPWWLAYVPVYGYVFWLACKHRGLRVVTACNPAIPTGGLVGESKADILDGLRDAPQFVARFLRLPADRELTANIEALNAFLSEHDLDFPIVLKPDVGERGTGVRIVRSREEATAILERTRKDHIAQEFVTGPEYGVSYEHRPGDARGRVTSITVKRPQTVTGDGRRTLVDLIVDHPRAVCMAARYLQLNEERLDSVPAAGEVVEISSLGNHRLGSLFLDGRHLHTSELEAAFEAIARGFDGFHLGRFDLRAESEDALRAGSGFKIIELNGLTAEPGHIYDPEQGTAREAYRALMAHWRTAFECGRANVAQGAQPSSWRELWRAL